ncbi:MAG: hypothetical protein ABJA10_07515 [Aestuariivirga sp.]
MAVFELKLDNISSQLAVIEMDMRSKFASSNELTQLRSEFVKFKDEVVTEDQFWPVKTAVYGIIGLFAAGLVAAVLALILRSHP